MRRLTFLGAARTVTGSKYLLEIAGRRVLVDCGLFQGLKDLRRRNWAAFPFDPAGLDGVILTHAHIDHSGLLPRLVANGFRGRILCTPGTADLCSLMLPDAGRLQEEDARLANRHGFSRHSPALPLFTEADAHAALERLEAVPFDTSVDVADGVQAEFVNAGHLLGSAFVRVSHHGHRTLFGGDLGRYDRPVLPDPRPAPEAGTLLLESTYGDREHPDVDDAALLGRIIEETIARGGRLIVPSFAVGRVQEVLYWLKQLERADRLPRVPIYVDSPMAVQALEFYRDHVHDLDPDVRPGAREAYAFSMEHHARHVPHQLVRRPHMGGSAELGEVLRRAAQGFLRAVRERGQEVLQQSPGLRHPSAPALSLHLRALDRSTSSFGAGRIAARSTGGHPGWAVRSSAWIFTVLAPPAHFQRLRVRPAQKVHVESFVMSFPTTIPEVAERPYRLEQIDDAAVVQLYADGFSSLSIDDKRLVWHLYQAALAGRDIYFDQRHRHALAMRDILEEIITHADGIAAPVLTELLRYTKLFWINSGPYNSLTARKFVLALSRPELVEAAEIAAQNGARFRLAPGEPVAELITRHLPMFLDATVDPMVTSKTPGSGEDILQASANNLYDGVTMADVVELTERHPLNSRLVKRDGRLVEEVYRLGGLYHDQIARIVRHLRAARPCAPEPLARALAALIRLYETGDDADREAFDIAWVQNLESVVDTMNGFIEVYMDARGVKGSWEGVVYYLNQEKTDKIHQLAANAQWFEDHLPIEPRFRKREVRGVSARAIEVVFETGDSGPITPIGVNLPNDQRIREQYGSKSVTLSNVIDAYEQSTPESFRHEFSWSDDEADRARQWGAFVSELTTEIHEVLGHGSGRMAEGVDLQPHELLKEQYSALEETRADLVALYFVADPYLVQLGLVPAEHHGEIVRAEYEAYARNALVQLRRVREGTTLEEDHMRNRQAIVNWLLAQTSAIAIRRRNGKTYYTMTDPDAFRDGVARLLAEVQRIKSEGDYAAARALFDTYGVHFDPSLRDEVIDRVDRLRLASYTAFVMPRLEAICDESGAIEDVAISYPCDLTTQMLEFSAERRAEIAADRTADQRRSHTRRWAPTAADSAEHADDGDWT